MMKTFFGLAVFIFFTSFSVAGQDHWVYEGASPLSTVDLADLPRQNNKILVAKVRSAKETREPKKFAQPIEVDYSPAIRGTWESIPEDRLLWRFRIKSSEAYSLNLGFKNFFLPPSAQMYIYDVAKTYVIGPVTNRDNERHAEWWSPILPFDEVVVEIQVDKDEEKALTADLVQVNHDFSGFGYLLSGSCNVDVKCGAADGFPLIDRYRDVINSVGMYTINGIELCTGALINTTRNNCTPYFLTAHHCEVKANNAASVVVYWNYENSTCRLPNTSSSGSRGNGPRTHFNTGSRLIASYDASDFTLLELDDDVNSEFDPFYAGWDADGEVFDTTFTVHHPNSEEKRISIDYGRVEPYADQYFIRIDGWEQGTTEGGSSGAPLFNRQKRIIGQLNGGLAACGNSDFDDFGMLKLSWNGGGTPSTRLKDWLDPDKTGALRIDGRYCKDVVSLTPNTINICSITRPQDTISVDIQSGYASGAKVEVINVPAGLSVRLSSDRIATGNSVKIILNTAGLIDSYIGQLGVRVTDEFTTVTNFIPLSIDVNIPNAPQLINPGDGSDDINFDIPFSWAASGATYQLQVSETPTFQTLSINLRNIADNVARVTGLKGNTQYFWRVKALNTCGEGQYSEVNSFTTGNIICKDQTSKDGPKIILEQSNVVRSTITVTEDAEIADLNLINVRGTHTWISDLEFRLIGPNGKKVDLLINGCEDEENFNISFDDESSNINLECPPLGGKAYKPRQALNVFDGLSAKGDWILEITDDVFLDGGSFESWTLELCLIEKKSNRSLSVTPQSIEVCQNTFEPIIITAALSGTYQDKIDVSLNNSVTNAVIGESIGVSSKAEVKIAFTDFSSLLRDNASLLLRVVDSNGVQTVNIPVSFIKDNISVQLQEPFDKETGVDISPLFKWTTGSGSRMTTFQLFDANGSELWDTTFAQGSSVTLPFELEQLTLYSWGISTIGSCSPVETTPKNSFTTTMTVATDDPYIQGIRIFPNPSSFKFTITKDDSWHTNAQLNLYHVNGKLMKSLKLSSARQDVDVSNINEGLYIIQLINGEQVSAQKLIINR